MSDSWSESLDLASSPEMLPRTNITQTWLTQTNGSSATSNSSSNFEPGAANNSYSTHLEMSQAQIYQNADSVTQYWQATQPLIPTYDSNYTGINTAGRSARHHFVCQNCPAGKATVCRSSKDLERHTKSVHHIYYRGDKFWMCPIPGCSRGSKQWPRRDNFTSHVERMHPDEDPKDIVARALCIVENDRADSGTQRRTPESGYISAADPFEFDAQQDSGYGFEGDDRFGA